MKIYTYIKRKILGLQTNLQTDVAQHNWVSQNLNLSHIQSCCATLVCKFFFFVKFVCKPSIPRIKNVHT
jgi:hypothetical protein